ncbi:MAG: hypothetical protein FJY95_11100 [Candidatus Handelsmanbacteria bacterium]|nr:hypothetical protein [Candidatus Handelsmanbacteria bacterium]
MSRRKATWTAGLALWCLAGTGSAGAEMARVIQVEGSEVVLDSGRREGLGLDAQVGLLREGNPIVHPLTGQVLGQPQEPVGMARVFEVGEHQSRAVVEKSYSPALVGDAAEFTPGPRQDLARPQPPASAPEAESADRPQSEGVASARQGQGGDAQMQQRLKDLERSVEEYNASKKTLKAYPVFAQRVWDEISTMKSYLVSLDERLAHLEEQSQERHHLGGTLAGEGGKEGMREFTIRYAPDTQVKVKVAGKTLLVSVERDSLRVVEEEGAVVAVVGQPHGGEASQGGEETHAAASEHGETLPVVAPGEAESYEGAVPWYYSPWVLGTGLLTLGLVAGVISWLIKRRYEEEEDEDEEED